MPYFPSSSHAIEVLQSKKSVLELSEEVLLDSKRQRQDKAEVPQSKIE